MIPHANPHAQYQKHNDKILNAIKQVLDRGNYVLGPEVENFENNFSDYCNVEYAVGVNSGTDALILALKALKIGPGDEVITVAHTALATIAAIIASGATPVLVDVDPDYYVIDPIQIKPAITPNTRAIIAVHLYGHPAPMDEIMTLANENNLFVIEDCAQATGATYKRQKVGSIGDIGCFSFYPTKNLGAIGDAGAIVTSSKTISEKIRRLRQYGWDQLRQTKEPGYNSRLDEIQAAILNVKLNHLNEGNKLRRLHAQQYNERLSPLPIRLPAEHPDVCHVYHLYVIACNNRDKLKEQLAKSDILAGIHYPTPGHEQPGYKQKCKLPTSNLPVTNSLCEKILTLPIYPELKISEIKTVCQIITDHISI